MLLWGGNFGGSEGGGCRLSRDTVKMLNTALQSSKCSQTLWLSAIGVIGKFFVPTLDIKEVVRSGFP
jgi:hypothetical protein